MSAAAAAGLRWAKGSSPDMSSQKQSPKLKTSAFPEYFVHCVNTSGAIQRRLPEEILAFIYRYWIQIEICVLQI